MCKKLRTLFRRWGLGLLICSFIIQGNEDEIRATKQFNNNASSRVKNVGIRGGVSCVTHRLHAHKSLGNREARWRSEFQAATAFAAFRGRGHMKMFNLCVGAIIFLPTSIACPV
ncbi:hypothetical protein V8F33_001135 [Rhypophila sp. PSN 637]